MPIVTLITGPRRSGKTHKALELARADGRPFIALAPTMEVAQEFTAAHPGVAVEVLANKHPQAAGNAIVLDAHLLTAARFMDAAGCVIDRGGDLYVVANPPTDRQSAWLFLLRELPGLVVIELPVERGTEADRTRFARLADIIDPGRAKREAAANWSAIRDEPTGIRVGVWRWLRRLFRSRPAFSKESIGRLWDKAPQGSSWKRPS